MHKLAVTATAAAAAALLWTGALANHAKADGMRQQRHYHHHHHWRHHPWRWGDNDYAIVRWAWGDCKIWHDDDGPPVGTGWVLLADGMPTWDAAWGMLGHLERLGRCN